MDVDLGKLPNWILMWDFYFQRLRVFQRDYHWHHNMYVNMRKESSNGAAVVLAAKVLLSFCIFYKVLKHES